MLKTSEGVHGDNKTHCLNFDRFDYSHLQSVTKFQFYFLFRYHSYQNHLSHQKNVLDKIMTEAGPLKSKNPFNDLVDLN